MGLNVSKGNMYDFVTHTWNTVKGACYHDCSYCYMKRWGKLNPIHFDEKELKTNLGEGNYIFVGSSNDLFADNVPNEWIQRTLDHCNKFDNKYLLQTKNPHRLKCFILSDKYFVCTTVESNVFYTAIMGNTPHPLKRAIDLGEILNKKYLTIEPIMDFDLKPLVSIVKFAKPVQVNIGADSGNNNLPEPSKEKILALIWELEKFTIVVQKQNLKRLLK